jgi:hypothetical protein
MRNRAQLELRQKRVTIANELLNWLCTKKKLPHEKVHAEIILPFSEATPYDEFEVWKAWDILKQTNRVTSFSCWQWEILSSKHVKMLENGNLE